MLDLVLDCGLFAPVNAGKGNCYQLSGMEPSLALQCQKFGTNHCA